MTLPDSISLPLEAQQWPLFRLFVRKVDKGVKGSWTLLPSYGRGLTSRRDAFHVLKVSRQTIGKIGELVFRLRFGVIDGELTNATPPDYKNYEVRCQVAEITRAQLETLWDGGDQTLNLTWNDCWHGWVEHQDDRLRPGAPTLLGERYYTALDASSHISKWPMRRHAAWCDSQTYDNCEGHPGYNTPAICGDSVVRGNRYTGVSTWDPNGDAALGTEYCYRFTYPGTGSAMPFNDRQVVNHALAVYRGKGDPVYQIAGQTALLEATGSIWKVSEADSAGSLVTEVLRRQRGRGVAFFDWDAVPTTGDRPAELVHRIQVNPQLRDSLTWTVPGGSSGSFQGAIDAGTTVEVQLTGDHRNVSSHFRLSDRDEHKVGYLESVGEKMQVLATLSNPRTDRRWSTSDATAFAAIDYDKRQNHLWQFVYQLYGLDKSWDCTGDNGNGDGATRIDYRCSDAGELLIPTGTVDTSPFSIRLLTTLPLYEGYKYDGAVPARRDAASAEHTATRRQPMMLVRVDDDQFIDCRYTLGMGLAMHGDEFLLSWPGDAGTRLIGDPAVGSLGSQYKYDQVVAVLGIELPHRVRMATGDKTATRKLRIFHPGVHLWTTYSGAIHDLDGENPNDDGTFPVLRDACPGAGAVNLLRDDRSVLAKLHALAVAWYGPDLSRTPVERRTARWSLRACCFLESYTHTDDLLGSSQTIAYPKIGQFVTTLGAGGTTWQINTPVTGMEYDNVEGVTTLWTDWGELDQGDSR